MTHILFFGRVGDAAGCSAMDVDIPETLGTVGELRAWLAARDDVLAGVILSPSVRVAVDRAFCTDSRAIGDATEIAFMSPLSGG